MKAVRGWITEDSKRAVVQVRMSTLLDLLLNRTFCEFLEFKYDDTSMLTIECRLYES